MKKLTKLITIIFSITILSSCAFIEKYTSQKPAEVTSLDRPKLDLKSFFNGDLEIFAITQDKNGKIIGSYSGKMNGKWDENKGVLQQNITYDDGKRDSRTWLITLYSNGEFEAVGHDFIAPMQGKQSGNAMRMIYTLSILQNDKKQQTDYEDNFYLVDERSAIGISTIKKFKRPAGRSIISYRKLGKIEVTKSEIAKSDNVKNEIKSESNKDQ
ncbi:MAG: DUF3833 family protein [Rickettsiales bacterium]|nr:DUF3833 family protein [Rickettsiales bacterium]